MASFAGVTFVLVLLRFRLFAFVEAATLRSIVLRYAGVPIATHVSFPFLFFCFFLDVAFFEFLFVPFPLYVCMKSTSYVSSFQVVFFYLVATGWMLDISFCGNSIKNSKYQIGAVWNAASQSQFHSFLPSQQAVAVVVTTSPTSAFSGILILPGIAPFSSRSSQPQVRCSRLLHMPQFLYTQNVPHPLRRSNFPYIRPF